jgi:hypothetical protein
MKYSIFALLFLALMAACSSDDNDSSTSENIIGMPSDSLALRGGPDTVVVKAKTDGWYIAAVAAGDMTYKTTDADRDKELKADSFSVVVDWLTLVHEGKDLKIIAYPNNRLKRNFKITLQKGDCTETINGSQGELIMGDATDVIGLTPKEMTFDAAGGTQHATTTKGTTWFVCEIMMDSSIVNIDNEKTASWETKSFYKKADWLTVSTAKKDIKITVDANTTGKERIFYVYLEDGDYFDTLKGIQKAK